MKKKHFNHLCLFAAIAVLFFSCKKREPADWDANFIGPLFKTSLNLNNLVTDSLKKINADHTVSLIYNTKYNTYNIKSLAALPDTGIFKVYTIPIGQFYFNPGDPFISNQTDETKLSVDDLELSRIIVKSGTVDVTVSNQITQPIQVVYKLPKAIKNGQPYTFTGTIPAATSSGPGTFTSSFDLSGYDMDLRGVNGASVNTVVTNLVGTISPTASSGLYVTSADSVIISVQLHSLVPYYALGYFGHHQDTTTTSSNFNFFDAIKAGTFSIDDVKLNFDITNGIGADMRFNLMDVSSANSKNGNAVSLQNSTIGQTINMQRATDFPFTPRYYHYSFNKDNSNIVPFIENLPNSLNYKIAVELNPFGNIGNGTDFVYTDRAFEANINMELPLNFSADNLTFDDTLSLDSGSLPEHNTVRSGNLKLVAANKFPFDADLKLYLLDANNQLSTQLFPESLIKGAIPEANGRVINTMESRLNIPVSAELLSELLKKRKLYARVVFNTYNHPEKIKIYDDYHLDLKLIGDMIFNIQIK